MVWCTESKQSVAIAPFVMTTRRELSTQTTMQPETWTPHEHMRGHQKMTDRNKKRVQRRRARITASVPALSSIRPPPPSQRSQGSSNQTQTQTSDKQAAPQIFQRPHRPQQAGTTCGAARASRGGICPVRGREFSKIIIINRNPRTINCASTSNTSDATRFRDAGVARRARAAPCRTRQIEPMMIAPTSTRFACRVAYVIFASVIGDDDGTSRRSVDARRSGAGLGSPDGVVGCEAGRKRFESDWSSCEKYVGYALPREKRTTRLRNMQ
jgi:hypothetical protein